DVLGITGGTPNDSDATVSYQWQRDGSDILINGTGSTYTVVEADEGHALQAVVKATDSDGGPPTSTTSNATSAVTDPPPSQPADSDATTNAVTEGASAGTAVGITASSTDPVGDPVTYSLTDGAGGRFQIDQNTGVVTVSAAGFTTIDYE